MFIDDTEGVRQQDGVAMIAGLKTMIATFVRDEDGAVTVDWVVLTAAVVGLGLVIGPTVGESTIGLSEEIAEDVDEVRIYQYTQSVPPGG
jgi:Flp pilus assembly pilin Flp